MRLKTATRGSFSDNFAGEFCVFDSRRRQWQRPRRRPRMRALSIHAVHGYPLSRLSLSLSLIFAPRLLVFELVLCLDFLRRFFNVPFLVGGKVLEAEDQSGSS
ncbi:hypothetical protein Droror1_Dr00011516 [Drosera rotundifolia]